jgi:hypothetical protein
MHILYGNLKNVYFHVENSSLYGYGANVFILPKNDLF